MRHDVAIIGAGIGGYPAAMYLADQGYSVAVIEEHLVGGECTNYGCVPSKALYNVAEAIRTIGKIGGEVSLKWTDLIEWSKSIVKESREGIEYLLEKRGVSLYRGRGILRDQHRLVIKGEANQEIEADKIVISTGTDPVDIPVARFDGSGILSNREILYLDEKPNSLLIIGGGVIGVEMANALSSLGVQVTIVELLDHVLPFTDKDIALALKNHLSQREVKVYEKTTVSRVEKKESKYVVKLSNNIDLEVDKVLVAVGRKPKTSGIGLENTCVELDQKGFIKVDPSMRACENIYASGDVTGGSLLAHKALLESLAASRSIANKEQISVNYKLVPVTIFTGLEIASIGYTEKELVSMGVKYTKYKLPIYYLSAVKIKSAKNAFVKILLDENSREVLGIHIVAPNASEVISAYMPLLLGKMDHRTVANLPYPHLTVSESLREIAEYMLGESVHVLSR